ncbi:Hypothetical protein R9X50_00506100 [Acrodontium crateriforme]|uniref:thioredoxin-dependent peroxiredoxin n=1 Tax=Acrodontium crateriforme TaxID=150365 RepID=A0AAQ3RAM2_9PEZI|nr:Hypothetical protein R9X50_00506100 [Acrodontium crateriforme]
MVELRKRPAPPPAAPPPAKKAAAAKKGAATKNEAAKHDKPPASNPAKDAKGGLPDGAGGVSASANVTAPTATDKKKTGPPKVGEKITLDGFGGQVETNDGKKVTLAQLVAESKAGVVLFTYPKASTPGCTKQACMFRDSYSPLTATGLSIYGLSTDSPKANTTFKEKQNLPYPLLCDPNAMLIGAIGLKKAPKGTTRGVFIVTKDGEVLAAEPGGPPATVDAVRAVVENMSDSKTAADAAEVADTAAKLDATSKV